MLIVAVGPIALLVGEALFAGAQRIPPVPTISRRVQESTEGSTFSPLRIGVALLGVLVLLGVIWIALAALDGTVVERWLRSLGRALGRHVGW